MFAPKLFYEVNDIEFDWKKIRGGLPRANYVAHDRNLTTEEIRKLMAYPDRRVKVIVLILISSGIRVGAFDYLKWKHVIPIENKNKEIIAAKLMHSFHLPYICYHGIVHLAKYTILDGLKATWSGSLFLILKTDRDTIAISV